MTCVLSSYVDFKLLEGVRSMDKEHMFRCPFNTPTDQKTLTQLFSGRWHWVWQGTLAMR